MIRWRYSTLFVHLLHENFPSLPKNKGSGKSACVLRIHHCLADGVSVLGVIEDILFHVDGSPVRSIIPDGIRKKFKLGLPFYKVLFRSMVSAFRVLSLPITPFDDDTVFSRCANKDMVRCSSINS